MDGVVDVHKSIGTVAGWISYKDVDKDGEAGFESERTGKPADLFHVIFDDSSTLDYQDLEEYEITECLADKILPRNRNGGRFIAGKTTGRRINRKGVKEK